MHVTVAICTWNRAALLDQTLRQMHELQIPSAVEWDLIVVNNNCTDDTDAVIARHSGRLPMRRVFEPKLGLSHARNAAVASTNSELILWTDDDVLVERDWLAEYVAAAHAHPDMAFFGGRIEPWFEVPPPAWLNDVWPSVATIYAVLDMGSRPIEFDERTLAIGANFAIRTAVQRRYKYNPILGRMGPSAVGGEEASVQLQMITDGHRGCWCPAAKVRHFIPKERLTRQYLRRYFHALGQTDAWVNNHRYVAAPLGLWGRVRCFPKAVFAEARYQLTRRVAKPRRWVKDLTKSSYYWGRLAGLPIIDSKAA